MVTQPHVMSVPRQGKPLADRVAIITGASRGIGAAIAAELGAQGARLVINYARSSAAALQLVEDLRTRGVEAIAIRSDVGRPEEAGSVCAAAMEAFGRVDILINNAGITRDKTFKNMDSDSWREVLQTNLDSVYYCTRAVLPQMVSQNWGRVINISSIIGQAGGFGQVNYAASKAGIIGFTKSLALEVARHGITVNAVCPGFIETDMLQAVPEKVRESIVARIPLGRFGQPAEVARLVRFLCAEGDWITGQQFNINGGQYM